MNCELVKRREQEEEERVTFEELEKQRVEAREVVEKEREIVEHERAVYKSVLQTRSVRDSFHTMSTECTLMHFRRET